MESDAKKNFKVGLFVFSGLLVFMAGVLLLGGDQSIFSSYKSFKIKFNQVQGLAKGSVVSLAGVPIGNVTEIRFVPNSQSLDVHVKIEKDQAQRITKDSVATVKTQGALGDKYIYISPGDMSGAPINENGYILSESKDDIFDVISKKGADIGNVIEIINQVDLLLNNINAEGRSALLMENLVSASGNLNSFLKQGISLINDFKGHKKNAKDLKNGITHFSSIMRKIDSGEGSLGALINDPSLHNKLVGILGASPRQKYLKPLIRETIRDNEARIK